MPNRPESNLEKDNQQFVDETQNLYDIYSKERDNWREVFDYDY